MTGGVCSVGTLVVGVVTLGVGCCVAGGRCVPGGVCGEVCCVPGGRVGSELGRA